MRTSLEGTKELSPLRPFFGGFTFHIPFDVMPLSPSLSLSDLCYVELHIPILTSVIVVALILHLSKWEHPCIKWLTDDPKTVGVLISISVVGILLCYSSSHCEHYPYLRKG